MEFHAEPKEIRKLSQHNYGQIIVCNMVVHTLLQGYSLLGILDMIFIIVRVKILGIGVICDRIILFGKIIYSDFAIQ